jgi:hypothetical protein
VGGGGGEGNLQEGLSGFLGRVQRRNRDNKKAWKWGFELHCSRLQILDDGELCGWRRLWEVWGESCSSGVTGCQNPTTGEIRIREW